MQEFGELSDEEKVLIAIGAAAAADCRRCAEKLMGRLAQTKASVEQAEWAFAEGFRARELATIVMREKAEELIGHVLSGAVSLESQPSELGRLVRVAAAVAANFATAEIQGWAGDELAAGSGGLRNGRKERLGAAIGIGRMVRSKAQAFSDAEISESWVVRDACGPTADCGGGEPGSGRECC